MATYVSLLLEIPEAVPLARLDSWSWNVHLANRFCVALRTMNEADKHGSAFGDCADALRIAVVIEYARIFVGGVRSRAILAIKDEVYDAEDQEVHDYVIKLRHKHIAHSINAFEEHSVTILVDADAAEREALSVGGQGHHTFGVGRDLIVRLEKMLAKLSDGISRASENERGRLLAIAKSMTPEQLAALRPVEAWVGPDIDKVEQARKA